MERQKHSQQCKVKRHSQTSLRIFLDGADAWLLKSADRQRNKAIEMLCWRHLLFSGYISQSLMKFQLENIDVSNCQLEILNRFSFVCLVPILQYFGRIQKLIINSGQTTKRIKFKTPQFLELHSDQGKSDSTGECGIPPGRRQMEVEKTYKRHTCTKSRFSAEGPNGDQEKKR